MAHSTTQTFPFSQEEFSPCLSTGQCLGITLWCHCPTALRIPPGAGKASPTASLLQPSLSHPQTSQHIPLGSRFGYQIQRSTSVLLFWGLRSCCRWSQAGTGHPQPVPAQSWAPSQERTAPNGNSALAKPGSASHPLGRGAAPHFYLISSALCDQEPLQALRTEDKSR